MQKRINYGILTVLSFLLFYGIMPLDIYSSMFYFLIIVGGILTTVAFAAFLLTFPSVKTPKKESNFGCVVVPVLIGCFFGFSILFLYNEGKREDAELFKYGVFTQAKIVGGSSFSTRKADLTHLTLEFVTAKGEKCTTNYSIDEKEFDNFHRDQTIPIVFSPRYPQVLRIFRKDADLQQFMEQKNRYKN